MGSSGWRLFYGLSVDIDAHNGKPGHCDGKAIESNI
jgi:hypothetical protein